MKCSNELLIRRGQMETNIAVFRGKEIRKIIHPENGS